jgi:Fic family protein
MRRPNPGAAYATYEVDEIAARFHHRLVWIPAYPNGNGRHARLATDLLLVGREGFEPSTIGLKVRYSLNK